MNDHEERPWWAVELPDGVIAFVPAKTPDDARAVLQKNCHAGAPVAAWPVLYSRLCSRAELVQKLLGRPFIESSVEHA